MCPVYSGGNVTAVYDLDTSGALTGANQMVDVFTMMAARLGPVGELLTLSGLSMVAFGVAARLV